MMGQNSDCVARRTTYLWRRMRWEYPTSCSVCHCLETGATWTCARSGTESAKEIRRRLAHHARLGCRAAADFSPRTNQTSDRRYDFSLMSKERSLFAGARADWVQRSCQASHGKCWSSQRPLEYRGPATYVWPCVTVFPVPTSVGGWSGDAQGAGDECRSWPRRRRALAFNGTRTTRPSQISVSQRTVQQPSASDPGRRGRRGATAATRAGKCMRCVGIAPVETGRTGCKGWKPLRQQVVTLATTSMLGCLWGGGSG
ncbi:hypothetical protein IWZ03DRAFT_90315 [Phyllosticta citriasiana]|uniref:Uncharacterized protein n=1 Tax=Phyllosticta citriasiana TaxID=595635 RepID=A0ABR1KCA9_9PEZI